MVRRQDGGHEALGEVALAAGLEPDDLGEVVAEQGAFLLAEFTGLGLGVLPLAVGDGDEPARDVTEARRQRTCRDRGASQRGREHEIATDVESCDRWIQTGPPGEVGRELTVAGLEPLDEWPESK